MKKILAIDDQKDNLVVFNAILKQSHPDYKILTAQSGIEGIEIAIKEQPDAILLDIIMPIMDGFETCKKLKAEKSTQHIPVIMVTAMKTNADARIKGLGLGADAFLSKPIDAAELSAQVNVMLRIKNAEDKLRKERDELDEMVNKKTEQLRYQASLIEQVDSAIITIDFNNIILSWNKHAEFLFQWNRKEAIGKNIVDLLSPEETKGIMNDNFSNLRRDGHWEGDFDILKKDGNTIPVHIINTYLKNINYQNIGFIGISTDISDRRKAEIALKESEERFKFSLKNSNTTVFNQDLSLRYTWIYNQAPDLPRNSVIGKTDYEIISKEDAEILTKIKRKVIETGVKENSVVQFTVNKNHFFYELLIEPIFDEKNNVIGISGISTDITVLENAKHKAVESDRLKTAFLENISHEIRTPMNGINGFSRLLSNPKLTNKKKENYISNINACSNQLLTIIDDILNISKIEAGTIEIYSKTINVNEKISEAISTFKPLASKNNIKLVLQKKLNDNESMIIIDEEKFTQIINNLINNAIKYTSKGFIELGYYLKNNEIEFYVKDTGIGIKEEYHEKIFDRFYQLQLQHNKLNDGTGLGLAISKAYVEALGGKIWLESKPGSGSVFYFSLPYTKYGKLPKSIDDSKKSNINWENKTILIAEDDLISYLLLVEFFIDSKAKLINAKDGQEAVDFCKKISNIDIVLMDLKMPNMDGYEAIKIIKKIRPDLPVIAQTAYAFSEDERNAKNAGADDFISKPINEMMLFRKINNLI